MPSASSLKRVAIACALAVATIAVYARAAGFDFINLDDPGYVGFNAHVLDGVTADGIVWAFTTSSQANWHPLTWLSLQLDAERGGPSPRAFHTTNVALHVLNVLLLLFLFDRLTGSPWKSGLVAALFALHPCHVESVAWVAERKDVLSTAFGLTAFHAWLSHVRRPSPLRLGLAAVTHAASLLAKPMFVSFPVLLLLFDVWPLARRAPWRRLVAEKTPFIVLSAASCIVTLLVQSHGGATRTLIDSPFTTRALNAVVSYVRYLGQAMWPSGLAVYYPFPYDGVPAWKAAGAASLLAGITWACLRLRDRAPYLTAGWLWYVVTLAPVIGLVQVGAQAMADRYTYVPLIGPFVMLAWGLGDLDRRIERRSARVAEVALVLVGLAALGISARRQLGYWKDSLTLFDRAVSATSANAVAHYSLAAALFERGELERGVAECREAVRIAPGMPVAESSLVRGLLAVGRVEEASARAREALAARPADSRSHVNAGVVAMMEHRYDAAELHFRDALRLDPEDEDAHLNLGSILMSRGRRDEAIAHFEEAVRLRPMDAQAVRALARARAGSSAR